MPLVTKKAPTKFPGLRHWRGKEVVPASGGMIGFDTETTGVDLHHGAKPFFVTTCDLDGNQLWWEWDVDPLTREPQVLQEDLREIVTAIRNASRMVLQNGKFDAAVIRTVLPDFQWPWHKVYDTLLASHILESNRPHDLTSLGRRYLRRSVKKYEDDLEAACKEARALCRQKAYKDIFGEWRIAKHGDPGLPSVKKSSAKKEDKAWKFDCWLPRAMARALNLDKPDEACEHVWSDKSCVKCGGHFWWVVLRYYANMDSGLTVALWPTMERMLHERELWGIYEERAKCLPIAYDMERRGVTVNRSRLAMLKEEYGEKSHHAGEVCVGIAASLGYNLTLPKGANNDSLLDFCFGTPTLDAAGKKDRVVRTPDPQCLNLPVVSRSDSGAPSLNKEAMDIYEITLPAKGKAKAFIRRLREKRKRDTSISYMNGYERFWQPWEMEIVSESDLLPEWFVLHPLLNPTGTDTLRWSSQNPNEQNISKQGIDITCPDCHGEGCPECNHEGTVALNLRYGFGPPPGYEWWSFDAKNIELRLPAYEAGEEAMIALFERPDDPPYFGSNHLLVSHIIHKEKFEDCLSCTRCLKEVWVPAAITRKDKCCQCHPPAAMVDGRVFKKRYAATWYQWVKNGNFAVQYGAVNRPNGLGTADRAYHVSGGQTLVEAKFSKMKALNQWCINYANKYGYIETMPDKTVNPRHGYPLLCTRSDHGDVLPTVPLNYRIQGTAMWWTMKAMNRVAPLLADWRSTGFDAYLVMQVHDELVVAMPKSKCPPKEDIDKSRASGMRLFRRSNLWRARRIQELMEKGGDDVNVPTPVGCEWHQENWSEGVTL